MRWRLGREYVLWRNLRVMESAMPVFADLLPRPVVNYEMPKCNARATRAC